MTDAKKIKLCADFLAKCLRIGWAQADLDFLEDLWWRCEGWRYARS